MKKILSVLLSVAMLLSVFAVSASAQTTVPVGANAPANKPNVGSLNSLAAKYANEYDNILDGDVTESLAPDFFEYTREEYIAYFTPQNASDNLKAFVELFFGMLYDQLYYEDCYEDDCYEDEPVFETVDEYLQYMIDENQAVIDANEEMDEAFLKLTDDDLQMLADRLTEYFALITGEIETPDELDPDYETPDDLDPDYETPDELDPDYEEIEFVGTVTVDDLKMLHEMFAEEIGYLQEYIDILRGFMDSETFEEDIKTLATIAALLDEAQNDCTISYYNDAYERFYNEYEDAYEGSLITFDDLEYFDVVDYVGYFFYGIGEGSFVVYLYADIDDLSDKQLANLKEVQSLFATLNSDVLDFLGANVCDSVYEFESGLEEYIGGSYIYGDADGNGVINMLDVLLIRKYIAKQPVEINLDAAEVTGDGAVNMLDVLLIRKYIAKQPVTLGPKG